jgi:hypothetical protein
MLATAITNADGQFATAQALENLACNPGQNVESILARLTLPHW